MQRDPSTTAARRRAAAALIAIGAAHAALAATHGGEFWPFSIYPMFSHAGRPWERALVIAGDASALPGALEHDTTLAALPGAALALDPLGIPQNDLSSLLQRAERWGAADLEALQGLFGALPCERPLLLTRLRGTLEAPFEPRVTPLARLGCEQGKVTLLLNPRLRPGARERPAP